MRFGTKIVQMADGRFRVPIPWNDKKLLLQSNRLLADSRLTSLLRRLAPDVTLLREYDELLKEHLRQGWLSEVSVLDSPCSVEYYLPHLPVIRREKKSTKLRIVFDASAKIPGQLR